MLCINECIQEQLQFTVVENRKCQFANSKVVEGDVVSPVEIKFNNRETTFQALVLPGDSVPVLGNYPNVKYGCNS